MKIIELIKEIKKTRDCVILPPAGIPRLREDHILPGDMKSFYGYCGGLILLQNIAFPLTVLPPSKVVPINPLIAGLVENEQPDDITWSFYTIAEDGNGDYFTIDCCPERLGRCYNSYHETHGLVGQTPIIAWSFTDFIIRMRDLILSCASEKYHWPSHIDELMLGDAYDI